MEKFISTGDLEAVKQHYTPGVKNNWFKLACDCANENQENQEKFLKIVNFLIDNGENPNDNYSLNNSCLEGNLELVKLLISKGATIETVEEEFERTTFQCACTNGNVDLVKYFLDGIEVPKQDLSAGMNYVDDPKIAQILIDYGADVNEPYNGLYHINNPVDLEFTQCLVNNKADINVIDSSGYSPLTYAILTRSNDHINFFLEKGTNPIARDVELAACSNNLTLVKKLIEDYGVSPKEVHLGVNISLKIINYINEKKNSL